MGSPGAELPRGTTRPACGVAQTVPPGYSHATFRPRPICGSCFYAVLLISATFYDSRLYELRGEYLSPLGLKSRVKDKKIQAGFKIPDSRTCPPAGGFQNLSAYRRISELVRLLADCRTCSTTGGTCPPTGGFKNLSGF